MPSDVVLGLCLDGGVSQSHTHSYPQTPLLPRTIICTPLKHQFFHMPRKYMRTPSFFIALSLSQTLYTILQFMFHHKYQNTYASRHLSLSHLHYIYPHRHIHGGVQVGCCFGKR